VERQNGNNRPSDRKQSRSTQRLRALDPFGGGIALATALILAVLAQSGLIASLLLNQARRRHADRALLASEERYRAVVESQTDMVCRFLPDTTLTFVNEAYCRFLGRSREKLLGKKFLELIPPDWHKQVHQTVSALINNREVISEEHEVFLPDGTIVWHHWENYPILNQAGQVQEYQGIGQDITARKRMEELTRNLMESSRLTLLGELTASIGHEISQPLGAILSNADALDLLLEQESPPLDEIRQAVADIRRDDLRASEIIHSIRSLLSGRGVRMTLLEPNEVVRDIVQLVKNEAGKRNGFIRVDLAPGIPAVSGDRAQLQQVLLNFILNGLDAMEEVPSYRREIVVRTALIETSFAEFSVSDSGHGISEEKLSRIFDSFFTTKKRGMGLGLAITRSIAEAHGGSVSAENNSVSGATFRFKLPIAREQPSEPSTRHALSQGPNGAFAQESDGQRVPPVG
jgi:PAS domain S-box-containing protein